MTRLGRDEQLESLRDQLEEWRHNLALRVAGEAQALNVELHKLSDDEIDEVWEILRTAQQQVFAGTDMLRDLRRRLQTRPPNRERSGREADDPCS